MTARYHLPVTAEQFRLDPSAKIPEGLIPVMIGRSGRTIMAQGHDDGLSGTYTRGYALKISVEEAHGTTSGWYLPADGDWIVTNPRGQRTLMSDADFKALYKEGP
jgi:hypothetical protein